MYGQAYVDKLDEDINGVKYLLVRQDVIDRNVDVKRMEKKRFQRNGWCLFDQNYKKNRPKKNWVDKGTESAGEFRKLCKAERIRIYSTLSETKAAYAEQAIRPLKKTLYRYMEDYIYNYLHKLSKIVTTLSFRKHCSIDFIPKTIANSHFFPFCTGCHYENIENPILKLETEFSSRSNTYP